MTDSAQSSQQPASSRITKAVIPAAGLGTRLRPLTYAFPKELLPVGRLPVLAYVAEELRQAGITEALFVVSDAKPQIREYFAESYGSGDDRSPLHCSYVVQQEQRGLGHAIGLAKDWTGGEPFVVAFGDCIIESSETVSPLQRLLEIHQTHGSSATTLVELVAEEKVSRYGIIDPLEPRADCSDGGIELADIVEKPSPATAPSRLAVAARWVLNSEIFDWLEVGAIDVRGEINLTDAVRSLKRSGGSLWASRLRSGEARRDIGNFGTFFDAFIRAALSDPEYGGIAAKAARETLNITP